MHNGGPPERVPRDNEPRISPDRLRAVLASRAVNRGMRLEASAERPSPELQSGRPIEST